MMMMVMMHFSPRPSIRRNNQHPRKHLDSVTTCCSCCRVSGSAFTLDDDDRLPWQFSRTQMYCQLYIFLVAVFIFLASVQFDLVLLTHRGTIAKRVTSRIIPAPHSRIITHYPAISVCLWPLPFALCPFPFLFSRWSGCWMCSRPPQALRSSMTCRWLLFTFPFATCLCL